MKMYRYIVHDSSTPLEKFLKSTFKFSDPLIILEDQLRDYVIIRLSLVLFIIIFKFSSKSLSWGPLYFVLLFAKVFRMRIIKECLGFLQICTEYKSDSITKDSMIRIVKNCRF